MIIIVVTTTICPLETNAFWCVRLWPFRSRQIIIITVSNVQVILEERKKNAIKKSFGNVPTVLIHRFHAHRWNEHYRQRFGSAFGRHRSHRCRILLHTNTQTHSHTHRAMRMFLILANVFISFSFFCFFFNWCDVPTILFARQSTYGSLSQSTHRIPKHTFSFAARSLQLQMWAHTNTQRARTLLCSFLFIFLFIFFIEMLIANTYLHIYAKCY